MSDRIEREILRVTPNSTTAARDQIAVEEPLELRVRGRAISVTMRTPGHDEELSLGFLISEGVIRSAGDVIDIEHCGRNDADNIINIKLKPEVHVDFERLTRHVFASSSCGLCGRATINSMRTLFAPIESSVEVSREVIESLSSKMRASQPLFDATGGAHAAALFDSNGELIVLREDVGRHNAVDKVIGFAAAKLLIPLNHHILLVSGRASFEIVQKALAARISVVAAVSAPSSLAVEFANENNQTLAGFLRDGKMNLYSGKLK